MLFNGFVFSPARIYLNYCISYCTNFTMFFFSSCHYFYSTGFYRHVPCYFNAYKYFLHHGTMVIKICLQRTKNNNQWWWWIVGCMNCSGCLWCWGFATCFVLTIALAIPGRERNAVLLHTWIKNWLKQQQPHLQWSNGLIMVMDCWLYELF